jgi:hypothetical protein
VGEERRTRRGGHEVNQSAVRRVRVLTRNGADM